MEEIGETSGLLYKRRGGFGKMMPQNWLQRYFVISKEGFLTYYDTDLPDKINIDTKSRGKIDLKTASYEFLEDQSAATELGEPTPFSIIIIPFGEERWKLCASTKEEFEKWTKGLQQIAIKVRNDSSKAIEDSGLKSIQTNVTQSTLIQKHPKRASTRQTMKLKKNTSSDFVELILTLLIMNLSYHLAAESTPPRKYIFAALATVVVGLTLTQRNRRGNDESVQSDEKHVDLIKKNAGVDESSTIALKQRPVPGNTLPEVKTLPKNSPVHSWCKISAEQFFVRVGPDYNKFKKKAPSAAPLFEIFAVDAYCAKSRIDHAAPYFDIPEELLNKETYHPHFPPVFIVQVQFPSEPPPSMFTSVEDGPGWLGIFFFKITEDTIAQLKDFQNASPAVKLFAEYSEKCDTDPAWRARFKVICNCSNLDEIGLPFVNPWNAKPILIRRTGSIFKGKGYIEKNIHIHKFATMAKQSIHTLMSRLGVMYMQIGFVVEGREDSELPETLFGCFSFNKPQSDLVSYLLDD